MARKFLKKQKLEEHQQDDKQQNKNIFLTRKTLPSDTRLDNFENALYKLIQNVAFKKYK